MERIPWNGNKPPDLNQPQLRFSATASNDTLLDGRLHIKQPSRYRFIVNDYSVMQLYYQVET